MITGSMAEFNKQLAGKLEGYRVYYNPTNRRMVFSCDINNYFVFDSSITMSHDLQVITGNDSISSAEILETDNDNHITAFCFENIWDRENVHIRASFVDLGYQRFLGVSNEQFIPPKEYPISYTDQKFSIELYDSSDNPVELPIGDSKDTLLIELILNSYT